MREKKRERASLFFVLHLDRGSGACRLAGKMDGRRGRQGGNLFKEEAHPPPPPPSLALVHLSPDDVGADALQIVDGGDVGDVGDSAAEIRNAKGH